MKKRKLSDVTRALLRYTPYANLPEAMRTFLRFRPTAELKHWRVCDGCGKRFSEQRMVWIDTQGWLCSRCQMKIS